MSLRVDKETLKKLIRDTTSEKIDFPEYISNSFTNPSIISLNSSQNESANNEANDNTQYFSFNNNLNNTTIQNLKSITLIGANIPTPITNIPDEETTFWYYRQPNVPTTAVIKNNGGTVLYNIINYNNVGYIPNTTYYTYYDGRILDLSASQPYVKYTYNIGLANKILPTLLSPGTNTITYNQLNRPINPPNIVHLSFCRLLPSFLPQEILEPQYQANINRQFSDYIDLSTTLTNITQNDPTTSIVSLSSFPTFRANDITFSLNQTTNKFSFTGNNTYDVSGNFQYYYIVAPYKDKNIFETISPISLPTGEVREYLPVSSAEELQSITEYGDRLNSYNGFKLPYQHELALGYNSFVGQGQPFVKDKTLNARLGWTNKMFNLNKNDYYIFNRPILQTYIGGIDLPDFTELGSVIINTANTYANLVNSSILYVYSDIVGTAGLDNFNNRNLLAIIPLNASNNSVAFYVPAIYNKIINIPSAFNSIKILLLNEYGNRYYIPNSAITTILIGLEYKN